MEINYTVRQFLCESVVGEVYRQILLKPKALYYERYELEVTSAVSL